MSIISREEHERLRSKTKAYESARQAFDPKRFQKGGGYTPSDIAAIEKVAGGKDATNEEKGKIELYEFVTSPPDRYFAYYDKALTKVSTWMGDKIGDIVGKGREYQSPMRDKRVNVKIRGINGVLYSGTCFITAGDYCRMKKVAGSRLNPGYSGVLSPAFYKAIKDMPNEALRTHHKGLLRSIDLDPMNPKVRLWTQQAGAISLEMERRGVRTNPLSKSESRGILKLATKNVRAAADMVHNVNLTRLRTENAAYAAGLADAVQMAGPRDHRRHATKIVESAARAIRAEGRPTHELFGQPPRTFHNNPLLMTVMGNPWSLKSGDKMQIRNIVGRMNVGMTEDEVADAVIAKMSVHAPAHVIKAVRAYAAKVQRDNRKLASDVGSGRFLCNPEICSNPGHTHRSKKNPSIRKVSAPPHFTVRCIDCDKKFSTANEPAYADLEGKAFEAYYCRPCAVKAAGREGLRSNPFEVHHGRGRDLVVQADPSARGMKTRFKTREEAERVFDEIGASEDQGYRVVEVDRSGRPIGPKRNPSIAFDVFLNGKHIDTIFYGSDVSVDVDEVKRSLVNHDGYDHRIVVKKRRSGASGPRGPLHPMRNPAPGESQWAFIPRTKRGLYIPAFEGTYEEALTAAKMYAARHKVETELWETDPANFRMQAWLKRLRATIRPHGGWELARKNPPASPTRWVKLARFDSESDYRKVELDLAAIGISVSYMDDWVYVRVFNFKNAADYLRKLKPKGQVRRTPRSNPSQADIVKAATSAGYTPADAAKVAAEFSSTGRLPFTIRRFFSNPSGPRATGTGRPRGYLVGGRRRTKTLEEAKALAKRIFEKTGAVVSIEEWPRKNPKANPSSQGVKRKVTMSLEAFARLVKAKNDPKLWAAFTKKINDYKKWTHGALPKKVTVETVNVPGMNGMWITYDAGKSPETTYIMPKGSKRKGAWKHEWNSMPDLKNDPSAGIVLTKLKGRSKITDFYHR